MPQPALWAVYLQVTAPGENAGETRRKQWIFMPAFKGELLEPGEKNSNEPFYFYRDQETLLQRTTWRLHHGLNAGAVTSLVDTLVEGEWTADPLITCEIHPREMAEITAEWRTPYRIITRLRRVSDATHRYSI